MTSRAISPIKHAFSYSFPVPNPSPLENPLYHDRGEASTLAAARALLIDRFARSVLPPPPFVEFSWIPRKGGPVRSYKISKRQIERARLELQRGPRYDLEIVSGPELERTVYTVETMEEASAVAQWHRDSRGLPCSEWCHADVFERIGKKWIATVSHNGRVWGCGPWSPGKKPILEASPLRIEKKGVPS